MIIIEAGATLTKVVQILNDKVEEAKFYPGINPNYLQNTEIIKNLKVFLSAIPKETPVHYYGTGCSTDQAKNKMNDLIISQFGMEDVNIYSDLLAAARATAKKTAGQINILGTGSASCIYDGSKIKETISNTGYLFGDHGSGYRLGHSLLSGYFENEFDKEINLSIESFVEKERKDMVPYIYQGNSKSKIAEFAKLVHQLKGNTRIARLIQTEFTLFIEKQNRLNPNYLEEKQYFVGSIAHYFADELRICLSKFDLTAAKIIQSPLTELCNFHLAYR